MDVSTSIAPSDSSRARGCLLCQHLITFLPWLRLSRLHLTIFFKFATHHPLLTRLFLYATIIVARFPLSSYRQCTMDGEDYEPRAYECNWEYFDGTRCEKAFGSLTHLHCHINIHHHFNVHIHGELERPEESNKVQQHEQSPRKSLSTSRNDSIPRSEVGRFVCPVEDCNRTYSQRQSLLRHSRDGNHSHVRRRFWSRKERAKRLEEETKGWSEWRDEEQTRRGEGAQELQRYKETSFTEGRKLPWQRQQWEQTKEQLEWQGRNRAQRQREQSRRIYKEMLQIEKERQRREKQQQQAQPQQTQQQNPTNISAPGIIEHQPYIPQRGSPLYGPAFDWGDIDHRPSMHAEAPRSDTIPGAEVGAQAWMPEQVTPTRPEHIEQVDEQPEYIQAELDVPSQSQPTEP